MTPRTPPPWPAADYRIDPTAPHPGDVDADLYEFAEDAAGLRYWSPRPEKWRPIERTHGFYVASATGIIRRADTMKPLRIGRSGGGTPLMRAKVEGRQIVQSAAEAVALAWLGEPPEHKRWRLRDNDAPPSLANIVARPRWETRRSSQAAKDLRDELLDYAQ